jgi:miniconductance mechanosensitive channel|nr:MAG: mechanosensitive ion channel protein MscS [Pseudomonadota bacterium]
MESVESLLPSLRQNPWALTTVQLVLLVLVVWLSSLVTKSLLLKGIGRAMRSMPGRWYDALIGHRVIPRLADVVPALVVHYGIAFVEGVPATAITVVRGVAGAYVVFTLALALSHALTAIGVIYEQSDPERAQSRPIKGYLQLTRIGIFMVAGILVVAALFNRDPLLLLSGLGAMTAVLMLVFKDTLLSFVASVQLSAHDMLRVGDWIEMPQLNADGDVIDISLHTVKVRNWDKTITMIPTWRLISESYKNWRGMFESGGRRIKRALYIDQSSVRFLSDEERDSLDRLVLLRGYLEKKRAELAEYNARLREQGLDPLNERRVTNIGTFRAYVSNYIANHPHINKDMIHMVRQLQPGPQGLPLEVYCFTASTQWVVHEGVQADIFDHLYAILPQFGLRAFQSPSGADITQGVAVLSGRGGGAALPLAPGPGPRGAPEP